MPTTTSTSASSIPPVSDLSDPAEVSCRVERWLRTERLTATRHLIPSTDWTIVCAEQLDCGTVVTDVHLLHICGARIPPGSNLFNAPERITAEVKQLRKVVA